MKGDRHKPKSTFMRWVDAFCDGLRTPKKTHYRVPSQTDEKKMLEDGEEKRRKS